MRAGGAESAFEHAAVADERAESGGDGLSVEAKAGCDFLEGKGAVGAGVAADELEDGRGVGSGEGFRQVGREGDVEGVAVAGCIFDGDEALVAGDFDRKDAAGADERVNGFEQFWRCDAEGDFVAGKIAEAEEEVVDRIGGTSALIFAEELEAGFDFRDGDGVEEFAEVGFAEKVGKLRLIDRESSGAAFGERGIAVVDEVADVSEQQGCREGRGLVACRRRGPGFPVP